MYTGIFDTHAHYVHAKFDSDRKWLLEKALPEGGVTHVMLAGVTLEDSAQNIALAAQYETVYPSAGIHPLHVEGLPEDWEAQLYALVSRPEVPAIGEAGLDFHLEEYDAGLQEAVFRTQLRMAMELDKPVILHIREATGRALEILREHRGLRGVAHCFSGSKEVARELTDLGLYLGIGGSLTFENARKVIGAVEAMPLERLVFETDAPYLPPHPYKRRNRCDSRMIAITAERAAQIRGTDAQTLIDAARENAMQLFGIA